MRIKGIFEAKSGGFGFVRTESGDIYIPEALKKGAMNGQEVEAEITEKGYSGQNDRGRIVKVLSPYPEIVGSVYKGKNAVFVVPDNSAYDDIFISKGRAGGAEDGDKVVAEIEKPGSRFYSPEGRIKEIIGHADEAWVDMLSVARSFGLARGFDKKTEKAAKALKYMPFDTEGRLDLRGETVFTIDGDDAKDLDDAVSVSKNEKGNYVLGVHIADVSYYVREGDPVDAEARKRGTSVYLPGMVVPMLPQILSNDLCSLNPDEDKLTLSCIMEIDGKGEIVSSEIKDSVIRSCARLTYSAVNKYYEGGSGGSLPCAELDMLRSLKDILNSKRTEKGSIDFDLDEPEIMLDEGGKVRDIVPAKRGEAERVIEECMLAANMTVAETFSTMEMPFIYRVHDKPDPDKIHELSVFLSGFGIPLKGTANIHPRALQTVLKDSEGLPSHEVIKSVVLRSMQKACYDCMPTGHFGLAAKDYCHFTSPIRRYPDLMVHRIVKAVMSGKMTDERIAELYAELPGIADSSSRTERNAAEAERAAVNKKMAEYMTRHIGEEYSGIVSGVTNFGVFVELENTIEGLVHISEMYEDFYDYDRANYRLVGRETGKVIRLGDSVRVICTAASKYDSRIEFAFS